jgi:queuine tRNA-ribosyltransferase
MGVGSPEDLLEGVARGIDMFDCVLPTRVARNGAFFTPQGRRSIRNSGFSEMAEPVVPGCDCYTCRTFSAAYLHHLFSREELLAYRLATIHNLRFLSRLMSGIREAILKDTFTAFKDGFLANYQTTSEEIRVSQRQKWLKSHRGESSSICD